MRIEVILNEETFRRFTLFDMMKRRKVWRGPAIWAGILCASALICFLMHHVRGAVLLGCVLLVVGLGLPASYFGNFARSLKQQILTLGLSRPQHVYTLTLSSQAKGIHVENEREQAEYRWDNVYHVYRDKTATYLFMNAQRGFILPHSCTDDDAAGLWELLERKLPKNRLTVL